MLGLELLFFPFTAVNDKLDYLYCCRSHYITAPMNLSYTSPVGCHLFDKSDLASRSLSLWVAGIFVL